MRTVLIFGFFLGVALVAFGWWGLFTNSGQAAYSEMAGMIPSASS